MGRPRHREFSHNFIDSAHRAIAEQRGAGFLPSVLRSPRENRRSRGASLARAQDPERPVTVEIGAGYRWTLSDVRDYFGDGYNFNGLGRKAFSLPASIEFRDHYI